MGSTPVTLTADSTPPPTILNNFDNSSSISISKVVTPNPASEDTTSPKKCTLKDLPAPFTAPWIRRRLSKDSQEESLATLRHWMPASRRNEISDILIRKVNTLSDEKAIEAIKDLKKPKQFVKGREGHQLTIPIQLTTTTTHKVFATRALVDSGCVGSCIDRDFVEKYDLKIHPTALPIPVYNADGSRNVDGSITGFVTVRLKIGDHAEVISLAVTKVDSADIFLGHDWLKLHNPDIDWATNVLRFNRCPVGCGYVQRIIDADFDEDDEEDTLEEGERIYMVNVETADEDCQEDRVAMEFPLTSANFLTEFPDVFSEAEFDQLPEHRPWDHAIDLTEGFKASDCKIYPLSPNEQDELQKFLNENLKSGRLRPSKSPMASPFFFIKKANGTLRPVQDYRKLNEGTIKNKYPLPLIQELIDKTENAKFFTKLDVRWGYNNIRIKEGDEWKAAFRTNRGLFEPTTMTFGLCNAPATFQRFMNEIFKDLIDEGHVVVYLDDILIFAETRPEHDKVLRRVLETLRQHKLFLRAEKCSFAQPTLTYLGNIIGEGQIRMDPKKIEAVRSWPIPSTLRQLQSFLGFCNYYRRFIRDFSKIARPLHNLTGKAEWNWTEDQQAAFDKLKDAICQEPVITIYVPGSPLRVETDSSDFANGSILSQKIDDVWHPVAFRSKSLQEAQRNYEIYDKELLAIIEALREWRHYLIGTEIPFEIWTDHQNLTFFREPHKINRRQARWYNELQQFNFTLVHKKGSQMGKADLLSRRADLDGGEKDNENVTVLKSEWFARAITVEALDDDFIRRIRQTQSNLDNVVRRALEDPKQTDWKVEDGIVMFQERLYVPRNKRLREDIIRKHHDVPTAGHPGQKSTRELITRNYFWPQLTWDVNRYVSGCVKCQMTKPKRQLPRAPLNPHDAPPHPWHTISGDLIGELPQSSGYNAICVFVDRFSKQIHAIPTHTTCTASGMATLFRDHVFKLHGVPKKFISDRGPQFESKFSRDLYQLLGIEANPSTAYHPQTDGQTERINQEIEQYLRLFVNYHQSDWAEWLSLAEFSYNDKRSSATGFSPFYINHGRHPYKGTEPNFQDVTNEAAQTFAERMDAIRKETESALRLTAETMKKYYDKNRRPALEYKPGDKVLLEGLNLTVNRPMTKFSDKRYGPFTVVKKVGKSAYRLRLPLKWKRVHPVFNEYLLTPYKPPEFPSQQAQIPDENDLPALDIEMSNEEYEVEKIVDAQIDEPTGRLKYLVKWKNYDDEENTWQFPETLYGAKNAVKEFYKQHPGAPRPLPEVAKKLKLRPLYYVTEFERPPPTRVW